MKFRYKVTPHREAFVDYIQYNIKIQKYNDTPIFHWATLETVELRQVLLELNIDAFGNFHYFSSISEKSVYDELSKYGSMDEIMIKYITNIILKRLQKEKTNQQCGNMIAEFVVTNGWKTIEIKENET